MDKLKNIEQVAGTDNRDILKDNKKDNFFEGQDGDDDLYFGRGNDGARGGGGADTFIYRGNIIGNNWIDDFEDGSDLIRIANAPDFAALTIFERGDHTVVGWNSGEVEIQDMEAINITEDDFIFV